MLDSKRSAGVGNARAGPILRPLVGPDVPPAYAELAPEPAATLASSQANGRMQALAKAGGFGGSGGLAANAARKHIASTDRRPPPTPQLPFLFRQAGRSTCWAASWTNVTYWERGNMMNTVILSAAILLALPGPARGVVDDLEDIGPDCTSVTSRVIAGVTIEISTAGGIEMTARTYYADECSAFLGDGTVSNVPLNPGNVSGMRFISSATAPDLFPQAEPIIFEFDVPVAFFGLTTLDLLENGQGCNTVGASLALRAHDASDVMVDEHARAGGHGPGGIDLDWFVSGNQIVRVELTGGNFGECNGYGIDDLVLASADCDGDGFLNDKDVCPCVRAPAGVDAQGRPRGDVDSDCDVDLDDHAIMQQNFTGPG